MQTDYLIETYICSCGRNHFLLKNPEQEITYKCKECGNKKFYYANHAWEKSTDFFYQYRNCDFAYKFENRNDNLSVSVLYTTEIPKDIDYTSQKVRYKKIAVYSLTLTQDGGLQEDYIIPLDQQILKQLKNNLVDYLNTHNCFNISIHLSDKLTLNQAMFFLKNRHLKEFEFYYWSEIPKIDTNELYIDKALMHIANYPKEKTVRNALYKNHMQQIEDYQKFDFSMIQIFCKIIEDVDILVELLNRTIIFPTYENLDEIGKETITDFILFLKGHYLESQILEFFESQNLIKNSYILDDTLLNYNISKDTIEASFKKVKCDILSIHDEFEQCEREYRWKHIQDEKLFYLESEKKHCIEINNYQVKLPINGRELFEWGIILNNYMYVYFDQIKNKNTIFYCFFKDSNLEFSVKISKEKNIQARRGYNIKLTQEESETFQKWFKQEFTENFDVI